MALERNCLDDGGSYVAKDDVPVIEGVLQSCAARSEGQGCVCLSGRGCAGWETGAGVLPV